MTGETRPPYEEVTSDMRGRSTNGVRIVRLLRHRLPSGRWVVVRYTYDTDRYAPQHHLSVEALDPATSHWSPLLWFDSAMLVGYASTLGPDEGLMEIDLSAAAARAQAVLAAAEPDR